MCCGAARARHGLASDTVAIERNAEVRVNDTNPIAVQLTIDGEPIQAAPGGTVLDACRAAGIHVPTLCHDPRLEPYGACRLCVVEVEGMRGYPAACTTRVADGMVITTENEVLRGLRRTVVELLLSDHKLDCLTCDNAGACALQDVAYELGVSESPFEGERHRAAALDENPLIDRDYDKCISCGRCVRICEEVQGCSVYSSTFRGFDMLPDTPFSASLLDAGCEFCGQCVSTCPVGALSNRGQRFTGRVWELQSTETTCGYCGVGCTVTFAHKDGVITGASAPLDRGVNRGNLCAKGRYGHGFVAHPDRLTTPLLRRDGKLEPASWDEAIAAVAEGIRGVVEEKGPDAIVGLASAKCTNEENYAFQKMIRAGVGTNNVDHCARL